MTRLLLLVLSLILPLAAPAAAHCLGGYEPPPQPAPDERPAVPGT